MKSAIRWISRPATQLSLSLVASHLAWLALLVLMQTGWTSAAIADAGDLNNDSFLDSADIMLLQRLLAGDNLSGLTPPLVPNDRVADLAPYDSGANLATPDGIVDAADLVVLMARIRAGATAIPQAPGPTAVSYVGTAPPPASVSDTSMNPVKIEVTTDPNAIVELVVDGAVQQTESADSSGKVFFDVYLNTKPDPEFTTFLARSINESGAGLSPDVFEVDYYDAEVRTACESNSAITVLDLPGTSPPSMGITLTSGMSRVISRGLDAACQFPVARSLRGAMSVTGGDLVLLPGSVLEVDDLISNPIDVSAGNLRVLGQPGERATIRGTLDDSDYYFFGIRARGTANVRVEYADILNPRAQPFTPLRGFNIGQDLQGDNDSVEVSILGSFVGYSDLSGLVETPTTVSDWSAGGFMVGPGNIVRIADTEIVGGGPLIPTGTRRGIGLQIDPAAPDPMNPDIFDLELSNATIANYSKGASITDAGALDPAESPPISLRVVNGSSFLANTDGLHLVSGARVLVDDSAFKGNCTGIWSSASAPLVQDSTVSGNLIGVRIDAEVDEGPRTLPVVRMNDLSGNESVSSIAGYPSLTCSGPAATVLSSVSRPTGSSEILNLTENYWGTTSPQDVLSEVVIAIEAGPDEILPFDASGFVDEFGATVPGSVSVVSQHVFDIRVFESSSLEEDGFVIRPVDGQMAKLKFSTPVDLGTSTGPRLRVQIFDEYTYSPTPTTSPLLEVVLGDEDDDGVPDSDVGPGDVDWSWDGRLPDPSSPEDPHELAPNEAYVFHLTVEDAASQAIESHPAVEQSIGGTPRLQWSGSGTGLGPIGVFSGEPLAFTFKMTEPTSSSTATGARVLVFADELSPGAVEGCNPTNLADGANPPTATTFDVGRAFLVADNVERTLEFPFRNTAAGEEDRLIVQSPTDGGRPDLSANPNGEVLCVNAVNTDQSTPYAKNQNFGLYAPYIIVEGTSPELTGAQSRGDSIVATPPRIRVEPYIVQHSYDQIVHFDLCLSQEADVTFRIMERDPANPAGYDAATPKATLTPPPPDNRYAATTCTGNDFHHFTWDAIDEPDDGIYTFIIEATSTRNDIKEGYETTTYRGFLDLRP